MFQYPTINNDNPHNIPVVIKDAESFEKFKEYLKLSITEMCELIHFDTQHRIIALYNVVFKVYRFVITAGKINGLEKFIKNRYIKVYNNDDNLCIFACLAYHLNSEEYLKKKVILKEYILLL
jgi:hypothetical protein